MDIYSEKELKYSTTKSDNTFHAQTLNWVIHDCGQISSFKEASGYDYFYKLNKATLRLRIQNDHSRVELTYKARKSKKSISDRTEINVLLQNTEAAHAKNLIEALGGKEVLKIWKRSLIYHLSIPFGKQYHEVCLAMYTVYTNSKDEQKLGQFLEVEIENTQKLSDKEAMVFLDKLKWDLECFFNVTNPLNKSLFEMYSKKR
jgi:predicted adenylyl cyclase CyaB